MNALVRSPRTASERALAAANLNVEELRREAMHAANERDADARWRVVESYIITKGRKRARTSPATRLAYRVGLDRLRKHWKGENLLCPSRDEADAYVVDLHEVKHGDRPLDPGTIQVRLAAARALHCALR